MENQKNNGGLIALVIVLCLLVLGLGGYIFYDKVLSNKEPVGENDDNNGNENVTTYEYAIYNKGDEIKLNDGNTWIVLSDSNSNQDYITVIAKPEYSENFSYENGEKVSNEFYSHDKIRYDDSYTKKELEQYYLPKISLKLKEVDGYKIRLITLEEVLNFNEGWEYSEEHDSYTYKGTEKIIDSIVASTTMTNTKCTEGKCTAFYTITRGCESFDSCNTPTYYIEHWSSGLNPLLPVINVYKTEISK